MTWIYRYYTYFGLATVYGVMLYGFRHDPDAPPQNILFNVLLYLAFGAPHLLATRGWFKRAVWGDPAGSPTERRVYVGLSIALWIAIYIAHRPMPGPVWNAPEWLRFIGMLGFILAMIGLLQGLPLAALDGVFAVPGAKMSHSHGAETPLMTEGPYAIVRHPMYRTAIFAAVCSILIHPNSSQVLWTFMMSATFVVFIPIEERQLIGARGEEYLSYMKQTPYRLFRRVW
jgi:protein-S-isoprenylcysteine O-methyltransferase Ste14